MIKKLNKLLIIMVFAFTIIANQVQAQNIDTVIEDVLNAWDAEYLGVENYSFGTVEFYNDAMFNAGTKDFTKRLIYQIIIDQGLALSDIIKTYGILEFDNGEGESFSLDYFVGIYATLNCILPTSTESFQDFKEITDLWISLCDNLVYQIYMDEYYSDLPDEALILLNYWFSSIRANLQIIKVKIYNAILTEEEEEDIFALVQNLKQMYTTEYLEKIHVFNNLIQNVDKVNNSNIKTRNGRKFKQNEVLLYYFK